MIQLNIHIYAFSDSFPLWIITRHWIQFPVLFGRSQPRVRSDQKPSPWASAFRGMELRWTVAEGKGTFSRWRRTVFGLHFGPCCLLTRDKTCPFLCVSVNREVIKIGCSQLRILRHPRIHKDTSRHSQITLNRLYKTPRQYWFFQANPEFQWTMPPLYLIYNN